VLMTAISLDAGVDSLAFNGTGNAATINFAGGTSTTAFGAGRDTLVIAGNAGGDISIAGSDSVAFGLGSQLNATRLRLGAGDDTLTMASFVRLSNATTAGGDGADVFSGNVSVGAGGVSFWGGSGADSFNWTSIFSSGSTGTAYFWNEAVLIR